MKEAGAGGDRPYRELHPLPVAPRAAEFEPVEEELDQGERGEGAVPRSR